MSGISAVYVLDRKGKILVKRSYRNDVPHHINDKFHQKIVEYDEFNLLPMFIHDNYVFFFTKHENITILAVSTRNSNAMMVFTFLHELKKI